METQDNLTGTEFVSKMNKEQGVSQTDDVTVKEKPPIQLYIIKTKISIDQFSFWERLDSTVRLPILKLCS